MHKFIEWFGWYGAAAMLAAYILVSFSIISGAGAIFQLLNFSGAVGIGIVSFRKHVYQSLVLNVIWGFIALLALIRLLM